MVTRPEEETETKIQIQTKQRNTQQVKIKRGDKKQAKEAEKKEEDKKEVKPKKVNKKKQQKMLDYLEKFGGESKEEEALRMKVQGYSKNFKMETQKKEYQWKTDEAEEIKFEESKEDETKANQHQ